MKKICTKVRYDEIGAMIALASIKIAKKGHREERRSYLCHICHSWHLTKQHLTIQSIRKC